MNKTRLQELCHRKRWNPPEYSTRKDGPPHNPTFIATVSVGGLSFSTDHPARSSKEAQSNAAGLAIQYLTDPKPPPLADSSSVITDVKNIPATKGTSQPEIQATSQSHQAHEAFLVTRDDKKLGFLSFRVYREEQGIKFMAMENKNKEKNDEKKKGWKP
uniref:DRBM domain-containing protein n=1 Tax=Vitis vinifera TaxID=29760 RepID=F6HMN7_VITVI